MILTVPDFIPISIYTYLSYFTSLFTYKDYLIKNKSEIHTTIYGYSCRSLFELIMEYYKNKTCYTTPIHHTSFRNIIEKYVGASNLVILNINNNLNEIVENDYSNCDIVVVSHLFGQDFDFQELSKEKEKHNFIVIEDRVQGGTQTNIFSHKCVDISLYSMGMDKRPVAMGGAFVNIRNEMNGIIDYLEYKINSLPEESLYERCILLLKNIPTYLIYNYKLVYYYISSLLCLMGFTVLHSVEKYREKNPGFTHNNYLKKPSRALLKSIYQNHNIDNCLEIEKHLSQQYKIFYSFFSENEKKIFFPWLHKNINYTYTMYNTIFITKEYEERFLKLVTESKLAFINNPTYKVFNPDLISYDPKYIELNKQLYYLPCVYNLNYQELQELSSIIKKIL